jgi:hypothetical protein
MDWKKILIIIAIIVVIGGCIAGIVAPAIVIDNASKIAPIVISAVILFFVLLYIIYKSPSYVRWSLIPLFYFGALLGGMIGIGVSDIDEGTQIAVIIFLSLLFFLSFVIGISYSGPKGEKYVSGTIYLILLAALVASIVIISTDTIDVGTVKVLTLICLGTILLFAIVLGFFALKTKTLGKFNFLGLNPKIQIEKIKSWGFTKSGILAMLVILIVAVVLLYIGGAQFINVYKNTTSKSDFDKNFALIWAILNFIIAAWITIQTIYFLIALGMMYWEENKKQCIEAVKEDIDETTGLPRKPGKYITQDENGNIITKESYGKLETVLEEFELAYSSADPTKVGYVDTINRPGKIDSNGIFIPAEFLDDNHDNVKDSPEVRLALEAYLANHRRKVAAGEPVIIPNSTDVRGLINYALNELKENNAPNDIIELLRERFEEIGGQAVRYQTAEAARELATRQEAAAREEAERRFREAEAARADRDTSRRTADEALRERDDALQTAIQGQRLAAEEGRRAIQAIARAEARVAEIQGQADFDTLQARNRATEAVRRTQRAEAALNRQRAELEAATLNEQTISRQAQEAFDRYNQARDDIQREKERLNFRIISARAAEAAKERADCNQRLNNLRTELNTQVSDLTNQVNTLTGRVTTAETARTTAEETARLARTRAIEAETRAREAETIAATADEAAVLANARAERALGEARGNAALAQEAIEARDEALRARAVADAAKTQAEELSIQATESAAVLAGRLTESEARRRQEKRRRKEAEEQAIRGIEASQTLTNRLLEIQREADRLRTTLETNNTEIDNLKIQLTSSIPPEREIALTKTLNDLIRDNIEIAGRLATVEKSQSEISTSGQRVNSNIKNYIATTLRSIYNNRNLTEEQKATKATASLAQFINIFKPNQETISESIVIARNIPSKSQIVLTSTLPFLVTSNTGGGAGGP